jgi:hypothetical protein
LIRRNLRTLDVNRRIRLIDPPADSSDRRRSDLSPNSFRAAARSARGAALPAVPRLPETTHRGPLMPGVDARAVGRRPGMRLTRNAVGPNLRAGLDSVAGGAAHAAKLEFGGNLF